LAGVVTRSCEIHMDNRAPNRSRSDRFGSGPAIANEVLLVQGATNGKCSSSPDSPPRKSRPFSASRRRWLPRTRVPRRLGLSMSQNEQPTLGPGGAMDPQRWTRIESLYHAALEKEPGQRPAFLTGECGDQTELRREVVTLLSCPDGDLWSPLHD